MPVPQHVTHYNGQPHGTRRLSRTVKEEDDDGRGGRGESDAMLPVKQATLVNFHLAIEDSVDIDKIWPDMQRLFTDGEQEEIQTQGNKKAEIKKLLDLLPNKEDDAFEILVTALRPEYKWLSLRLQQGVKDEEKRVNKMGKGIKRKIAIALLTARISERQKDGILDRVTAVVESEMSQNCNRVNIPDHRAAAQLDREHRLLKQLIRDEVDPLLYGEGRTSARSAGDDEEEDDTVEQLKDRLDQLQVLKECYTSAGMDKLVSGNMPNFLLQKIQEVQIKVKSLLQERNEVMEETDRLLREKQEQHTAITKLQQNNRNLEMENRALESSRQTLENSLRKSHDGHKEMEKDYQKVTEENRDLTSKLQQVHDRLSSVSLRNHSLDTRNSKLTRDNVKLTTTNSTLRKEARNRGIFKMMEVKAENKRLAADKIILKKDLQKMEAEKRQLAIRSQRLVSENHNLREQKRKLLLEKRHSIHENKLLKTEAKRLAIGKYSPLPPITEDREPDAHSATSGSRLTSSESKRTSRKIRSRGPSPARVFSKTETPWNKYKDEDNKPTKGKVTPRQDKEDGDADGDEGEEKVPGYLKATASSKRHNYMEDEAGEQTSPRMTAAWK